MFRSGEGNGNPLQCSCLENPKDGGAWWACVYGVAQSWTRLKRLSSSSVHSPTSKKETLSLFLSSLNLAYISERKQTIRFNFSFSNLFIDGLAFFYILLTIFVNYFYIFFCFSLCCFHSVAQSCPTLCDPIDCSTPGFPVPHYLSEFAQTHVH